MLLFRPSRFTNVKPGSQVLQPPPYSLTTPPKTWSQSILRRLDTWDQDHDFNSLFTNHCNFWAIFDHSPHFSPCPEMRPLPNTLWASPSEYYFHQVAVPAIQVSVPVTFQLLPSTVGALDITFFRVWCHGCHRSYVGWKCGLCVAHALEDRWRNCVEICWLRWIADPNPCYGNLLVLISSLTCPIWI